MQETEEDDGCLDVDDGMYDRTKLLADETMLTLLPQRVPNANCQLQSSVLQNMIIQTKGSQL